MRLVTESLSRREKEQLGPPHLGPDPRCLPSVTVGLPLSLCLHLSRSSGWRVFIMWGLGFAFANSCLCSSSRFGALCRVSPVPGTQVSEALKPGVVLGQGSAETQRVGPGVARLGHTHVRTFSLA